MLLPSHISTPDIQNCDKVAISVFILKMIKGVKKDWSISSSQSWFRTLYKNFRLPLVSRLLPLSVHNVPCKD